MKALAIAVAMFSVVTGIIVAVLPHGTRASHARAAVATASPVSPVTPVLDLSEVRWTSYHGYQLPISAQAGPKDTSDDLASGFDDTPTGALLAVINIAARTAWQFGPAVFQPTIQDQVTGPYQAQMLSADQDAYAAGAAQAAGVVARSVIAGYQWAGYTPADATVDIAEAGPAGDGGSTVYVATQVETQWLNGDWRVLAPPGGDWANSAVQIPSLNGYLTFPGQQEG